MTEYNIIYVEPEPNPAYVEYEGTAEPAVVETQPEPSVVEVEGPEGSGTDNWHEFQQTEPAEVWTVNHNLGRHPTGIQVRDSTGRVIGTEINHLDPNTFTSTIDDAMSGRIGYSG